VDVTEFQEDHQTVKQKLRGERRGKEKTTLLPERQHLKPACAHIRALYLHAGFNPCYQILNSCEYISEGRGGVLFKKLSTFSVFLF